MHSQNFQLETYTERATDKKDKNILRAAKKRLSSKSVDTSQLDLNKCILIFGVVFIGSAIVYKFNLFSKLKNLVSSSDKSSTPASPSTSP